MRIVLIGCVESTEKFLRKLIDMKVDLVGVITKERSSFNSDYVDLVPICKEHKIEYVYTSDVNEEKTVQYIRNKKPDLLLCLGWSQIVGKELLRVATYGSIGFHPAKLPSNRGRHPLIWALALDLKETASTLFLMDDGADTGAIISQEKVSILYEDDAKSLYEKVMNIAVEQLEVVIYDLCKNGCYSSIIYQDKDEGNVWRKRDRFDGLIDWRMSSHCIYNLVRALTKPYVGAHFFYNGNEYKVWKVKEVELLGYENIEPGKVLLLNSQGNPIIKTGDKAIELVLFDEVGLKKGDYL